MCARGEQEAVPRKLESVSSINSGYLRRAFSWSDSEAGSSWSMSEAGSDSDRVTTAELAARLRFTVQRVDSE